MDKAYRTYKVKGYEYGWMVYHVEAGAVVMDMCYAREEVANSAAKSMNDNEPKRVADVIAREAAFAAKFTTHSSPYFSMTGYYGD